VGLEEDVPMILFLGTPVVHKGLSELIAAVEALPGSYGARLWIVGDPPDGQPVSAALSDSSAVELRPYVPFAEAAWFIAACDVFVAPQRFSPYAVHQIPGKLLHAMALGACIVSTDVGDIDELLGGSPPAGVVGPPGDVSALTEALEELLRHPDRRAALSSESRRRAEEHYSWRAMARALDEEIAKLGVDG
jgi:glycosyltransferase involved in cell wall biosynthesis